MEATHEIIVNFHQKYFKKLDQDFGDGDLTLIFSDGLAFSYQQLLFYLIYPDPDIKMLLLTRRDNEYDGFPTNIIFPDLTVDNFEKFYINSLKSKKIKHFHRNIKVEDPAAFYKENHPGSSFTSEIETEAVKKTESLSICEECGRTYANVNQLNKHIYQKHSKQSTIICKNCGDHFKHQYELNKHMFKHMSVNYFACEICDLTFKRRDALGKHKVLCQQKKTGQVKFKCKQCECDKSFSSLKTLNLHEKSVHSSDQFPCIHCEKVYTRKDNLKRHLSMFHKSEEESTKKEL